MTADEYIHEIKIPVDLGHLGVVYPPKPYDPEKEAEDLRNHLIGLLKQEFMGRQLNKTTKVELHQYMKGFAEGLLYGSQAYLRIKHLDFVGSNKPEVPAS